MKTKKMSLANIQGKLSRTEMKNIIAGDQGNTEAYGTCCTPQGDCGGPGCRYWTTCNYIFTKC